MTIDTPMLIDHLDAIIDHLQALRAMLDAHGTVDGDTLMVARAIQGEGAALFGARRDEMARWIAHVAYNRYEKDWWQFIDGVSCTFAERTEHDFHGTALVGEDELEPWAIRLAYEVMTARRAGGPDEARGALFAVSLDDIIASGWDDAAVRALAVQIIHAPDDPATQFWFLTAWPKTEASE
jgi:hypothetical protein